VSTAVNGDSFKTALATTFLQDSTRAARADGPLFRRSLFNMEFTFVCGVDLVAELSDERRFAKHVHPNLEVVRPFLGDGILTAETDDPNWRAGHEVLAAGFTQAAMRGHHGVMLDVARQLLAKWDRAGEAVDVPADFARTSLEIIGRAGFGYSFDSFERDRPHPFAVALNDVVLHGLRAVTRPPLIGGLLGRHAIERNAGDVALMNDVVEEAIESRRGEAGPDLLAIMLASARLSRDNIRYQVLTLFAAGHETSYATMAFALHYLLSTPGALARARAEVNAVWGEDAAMPGFDQVGRLRYLRRVVDETLRLWPAAPGFARQAREDTVLAGRYPLRAGEPLFILLPALHREPLWGGAPEAFDPERFLPERVRARPPHAYRPFGTGYRACIGRQFALHEILLVLGLVLRRYDLSLPEGHELRVRELMTFLPGCFSARVTRR
jgi:cytochrome P450